MFKMLKDELFVRPRPRVREVHHEQLGLLRSDDAIGCWETQVEILPLAIQVGGAVDPTRP
jgi:hypothetical protein